MTKRIGSSKNYRAHHAVRDAIQAGTLPAVRDCACVDCGTDASRYHHTHGYAPADWLRVVPVCTQCHYRRHHPEPEKRLSVRASLHIVVKAKADREGLSMNEAVEAALLAWVGKAQPSKHQPAKPIPRKQVQPRFKGKS